MYASASFYLQMYRFESYLFRWLERSLPVQLGRKARRIFDQFLHKLAHKLEEIVNPQPAVTNHLPVRKLLKPVYALVKRLVATPSPLKPEVTHQTTEISSIDPDLTNAIMPLGKLSRKRIKLEELIQQAIAYFFRRNRSLPDGKAERLAMYEEIFDDLYGKIIITQEQPPLTTTAQTVGSPATGIDIWLEEVESYSMRAWIETQAIPLGYAESPVMKFLLWLDKIIAKIEQWFIKLWEWLVNLFLKFIHRT
ncbi:MAG: hypothetical protein ACK4QL_07290 [Pseudanabaenaceae cyanobacterium]